MHYCIPCVQCNPYDLLSDGHRSSIRARLLGELAREREREGKAEAPLYLLCQHMHSTSTYFLFPTTKSTLDTPKKNPRGVKKMHLAALPNKKSTNPYAQILLPCFTSRPHRPADPAQKMNTHQHIKEHRIHQLQLQWSDPIPSISTHLRSLVSFHLATAVAASNRS